MRAERQRQRFVTGGQEIVLGRVRARAALCDAIPSRLWLEHALAGSADRLPGMAPDATLLVQNLRHLAPPPSRGSGHGAQDSSRWRGSLRSVLSAASREAARPAGGAVPANANAVLFADQAELLSCLASDWLDGALSERWWWRALADDTDGLSRVIAVWLEQARHGPPALEILARRNRHIVFARALGPEPAMALADATATAWAMHPPGRRDGVWSNSEATGAAAEPDAMVAPWQSIAPELPVAGLAPAQECLLGIGMMLSRAPALATSAQTERRITAWLRAVHQDHGSTVATPALRPARTEPGPSVPSSVDVGSAAESPSRADTTHHSGGHRLGEPENSAPAPPAPDGERTGVLTGAGTERAGAWLDGSASSDAVPVASAGEPLPSDRWLGGRDVERPAPPERPDTSDPGPDAWLAEGARLDGSPAGLAASAGLGGGSPRPIAHAAQTGAAAPDDTARPRVLSAPDARKEQVAIESRSPAGRGRVRLAPPGIDLEVSESLTGAPVAPARARSTNTVAPTNFIRPVWRGDVVHTELAGTFYLLNVAIAIGHYDDFSFPARAGLALSPWDWVVSIARRLLPRARRDDPVWVLLSALSGRPPGSGVGFGFTPPRGWRVPRDWFVPLPPSRRPWLHNLTDGRLFVRHPLGFTAVDVPAGPDPPTRLRRELGRLHVPEDIAVASDRSRADEALGTTYVRWTARTAEYVAVRLRLALGANSNAAAARMLLSRPGVIVAGRERVDVRFALDGLPVAIRAAGLDRDPGWIPATGRTVAFHYD